MAPNNTMIFANISARMKPAFGKRAWSPSPNFPGFFQTAPPVYPYLAHPCSSFSLAVTPFLLPQTSILQLCCESSVDGSYTTTVAYKYSTAEKKAVMEVSVAGFLHSCWEDEERGMY